MTGFAAFLGLLPLLSVALQSNGQIRTTSVLVLSLPSVPTPRAQAPYAGRLYHGTWRWVDQRGRPAEVDAVRALTEAVLSCGQRRFEWRGLDSDHGNNLLLPNNQAGRRAIPCIAGKVSFDFYVRVELIKGR